MRIHVLSFIHGFGHGFSVNFQDDGWSNNDKPCSVFQAGLKTHLRDGSHLPGHLQYKAGAYIALKPMANWQTKVFQQGRLLHRHIPSKKTRNFSRHQFSLVLPCCSSLWQPMAYGQCALIRRTNLNRENINWLCNKLNSFGYVTQ